METIAHPRDLPTKFRSDLDIFKAYLQGKIEHSKMNKTQLCLYGIQEFNIKKMHLNDELVKLLKAEPSVYRHLNFKNKCIKKMH